MVTRKAKLASRLKELGINESQLARLAGVSIALVSRWLSGERSVSRRNIRRLAEITGLSIESLLFGEEAGAPVDAAEIEEAPGVIHNESKLNIDENQQD